MLHTVDAAGESFTSAIGGSKKLGYRRDEVLGRLITEFMGTSSKPRSAAAG
jgi:hypothetical protein